MSGLYRVDYAKLATSLALDGTDWFHDRTNAVARADELERQGYKRVLWWFDSQPTGEPLDAAQVIVRQGLQRRFGWLRLREEGA